MYSYDVTTGTKKAALLPSWRLTLSVTGFLGCMALYLQRINMSLAIICMTNETLTTGNVTTTEDPSSQCQAELGQQSHMSREEFNWDRKLRGFILSSFFIGYVITQIPGGWLAGKVGGKWVLGGGMVILTAATLLTPVAARTHPYLLMVVRGMAGIGSGVYFPANHAIWSQWSPPRERSRLVTLVISGNSLGTIVTYISSGYLCEHGFDNGWGSVFYVHGSISAAWLFLWFLLAADSPSKHPWISETETMYIQKTLGYKEEDRPPAPWLKIVTSVRVWAIIVSQVTSVWIVYTVLTSLPLYMKDVLKFDIKSNGLYNAIPSLCQWVCTLIGASLADALIINKVFSVGTTRKLMVSLGLLPPAVAVIIVSYLECSERTLAVILLSAGMGIWAFGRSGHSCNMLDIAPRYAPEIMGISNFLASITGILTPIVSRVLTPNGAVEEWRRVFFVCAGMGVIGALTFLIFASGEIQPWDSSKQSPEEYTVEMQHSQRRGSAIKRNGDAKSSDTNKLKDKCDTQMQSR